MTKCDRCIAHATHTVLVPTAGVNAPMLYACTHHARLWASTNERLIIDPIEPVTVAVSDGTRAPKHAG